MRAVRIMTAVAAVLLAAPIAAQAQVGASGAPQVEVVPAAPAVCTTANRDTVLSVLAGDPPQHVLADLRGASAESFLDASGGPNIPDSASPEIIIADTDTPDSFIVILLAQDCALAAVPFPLKALNDIFGRIHA